MKYGIFLIILLVSLSSTTIAYAQTYSATLTLDSLPSSVNEGNTITFSGQLTTSDGQYVVPNRTINIKSENQMALDTFIGYVTTDNNGKFSGSWKVISKNDGSDYHIYAVFDGDSKVGGARSQTFTVSIQPVVASQIQPSQTTPQEIDYYLYVDPAPAFAPSYVANSIPFATNYWEKVYPNVKFHTAHTKDQANVFAEWTKDFGQIRKGEEYYGHTIEIGLGDSSCYGNWHPFSEYTVVLITTHELGHILGLQHNSDPQNIMYEGGTPEQYGIEEYILTLPIHKAKFIPICTHKDVTAYDYQVTVDDPTYGVNIYFVPSSNEQNNLLSGSSFQYYASQGCSAENYLSYGGTCNGVARGSGLLIVSDNKLTGDSTQVTVKILEKSSYDGQLQQTSSATHVFRFLTPEQTAQQSINNAIQEAQKKTEELQALTQSQVEQAQQEKTQAEIQQRQAETEAAKAQAIASEAKANTEKTKVEAEAAKAKAQEEAEKTKLDAENKIKQVSQAYDKKSFYRGQIDGIKNSLKDTEQSLSGLKFESSDAKKKIDQVWQEKNSTSQDITNAENNWLKGSEALNNDKASLAMAYFNNISSSTISSGNHLASISKIIDDAQKTEDQYKKSRVCFLFWCW